MAKIPEVIQGVLQRIKACGGRSFFVGGYVRYTLGGPETKDYDIEVFGVQPEKLRSIIEFCTSHGIDEASFSEVGKAFGVFKVVVDGIEFDFSLPRRDNNVGVGHKDFNIVVDPDMQIAEAAKRRDFTMNAIYMNTENGALIDPYGGIDDFVIYKVLRPVDPATFVEDPLRALRAFRFLSQLDLTASDSLVDTCSKMVESLRSLPKERVWEEWKKWSLSVHPEKGILFLRDTGLLSGLYPEISSLEGVVQDVNHHPEGDVLIHTYHVLSNVRTNPFDDRSLACFAALCHDFGKVSTTIVDEAGKITAYGHQDAGVAPATSFLDSIGAPYGLTKKVEPLIKEHMVCAELGSIEVTPRIVRRLANRLYPATINDLSILVEADISGRPPKPYGQHPTMLTILRVSQELGVTHDVVTPIIMGRHLIDFGMKPDPIFKKILASCFEAQLDGVFHNFEEGRIFLRGYLGGLHDQ